MGCFNGTFRLIYMRIGFVGNNNIGLLHHKLGNISMEIYRYDHRNILSDNIAHHFVQFTVGVFAVSCSHSTMITDIYAIQWCFLIRVLQHFSNVCKISLKEAFIYWTPRLIVRADCGDRCPTTALIHCFYKGLDLASQQRCIFFRFNKDFITHQVARL